MRLACFPPLLNENPYQRLLYESLEPLGFDVLPSAPLKLRWLLRSRGRIDVLHLHWPESYYRSSGRFSFVSSWLRLGFFTGRLIAAKLLGFRIVWTVHQVRPHEDSTRTADYVASRVIAAVATLLFAHDDLTKQSVTTALGVRAGKKVKVVAHAAYVEAYPSGRSRRDVRAELGIPEEAFVFLAFGHVRRYKRLDVVLNAFRAAPQLDATLVVAGLPVDPDVAATVRDAAVTNKRIVPRLEFVPDDRVAELFKACDACVMTRVDEGTSGALILSLSLGLPAVVPAAAPWEELVGDAGWVYEAGSEASLIEALSDASLSSPSIIVAKQQAALARALRLSPAAVADETSRYIRASLGIEPDAALIDEARTTATVRAV